MPVRGGTGDVGVTRGVNRDARGPVVAVSAHIGRVNQGTAAGVELGDKRASKPRRLD